MKDIRSGRFLFVALSVMLLTAECLIAEELPSDLRTKIDSVAKDVLAKTGVPSASIAIVKDGQISYVQAYGSARLDPETPAKPEMRYSIGSISKQFTAAAILMLQEQGKLSVDDKVGKYLPDLTRANEVTIRQLLSHTSGYQDFWPQDYVMPRMLEAVTAKEILDTWGKKSLDFDPGTKWQYSNTNYVIAGVIIEKVSGTPLIKFLHDHVFAPLQMDRVADTDDGRLYPPDPAGYLRYALGPSRPAPKEGRGWMFAAGELAMPAEDLAKWDISIIDQKLLKPASYRDFETEVVLKNGVGTQYALGIEVKDDNGRRELEHSGEVSGFTAENIVYPDDKVAIAVLTNQDAASASGQIGRGIAPLLFQTVNSLSTQKEEQARKIFEGLQRGQIDRSLFTSNCNAYFSDQAIQDFENSLAPLGKPQEFTQRFQELRGGMTLRVYQIKFPNKTIRAWTYEMPDGKLEQYQVAAVN